jgi:hypothetical protein
MSCWIRIGCVVVMLGAWVDGAWGQTRIGPGEFRVAGEGEHRTSNIERRTSKGGEQKEQIPASDRPGVGDEKQIEVLEVRKMFLELEDADPRVRERARERLMGLGREDLKVLMKVVGEFAPLEEQMVGSIKEIVTHVYLSEDQYEKEGKGFLGIVMPRPGDEDRMQVVVDGRMPGFGGYAALRDGDVILDVVGQPLPQPLDRDVFIDVIKAMRPESVVKLKVLRQGAVRVVAVKISARPAEKAAINAQAYEAKVQELLYRRGEEAEKYWKESFGEVVSGGKGLKTAASAGN